MNKVLREPVCILPRFLIEVDSQIGKTFTEQKYILVLTYLFSGA